VSQERSYGRAMRKAPGIVTIDSLEYGRSLWTERTLRRNAVHGCSFCGRPLAKGAKAFGPITNGHNRWHRVCVPCIDQRVRESEA
jgi:hypothetical protein